MTTTGMENDDLLDEQDYDATEPDEGKWSAVLMIGLLALLAAFAGFVYLAYMQGVRNGAVGAPPVITADKSPFKVPPENPGGQTFKNQDMLVYDRTDAPVASVVSALPAPGTASPASSDDLVATQATPLVVADAAEQITATLPNTPTVVTGPDADGIAAAIVQSEATPDTRPLSIEGGTSTMPVASDVLPTQTAQVTPRTAPPEGVTSVVVPPQTGPTKIGQPVPVKVAPASTTVASAPAPATKAPAPVTTPAASAPITTATAASGAYVVQIASYRDRPSAEDAWSKFNSKFSDISATLSPNYQTAEVPGKGTYVRVRVGPFETKDAANSLCATLKARSQSCLVVKS